MKWADSELCLIEPLNKSHNRGEFICGVESLDNYLRTQASQDMRRKSSAVFVLVKKDSRSAILGYFTLSAYGIEPGSIPEEALKDLPRYPILGATMLGRLAVALSCQGQGLGSVLLAEALRKAYENASLVGSCMVVVDALDQRAAAFYLAHGFVALADSTRLILPMRALAAALK